MIGHSKPGPCITNVIATCCKNFSQWERSFLWKLRCHWLKFLRRVAKTLVIQGPVPSRKPYKGNGGIPMGSDFHETFLLDGVFKYKHFCVTGPLWIEPIGLRWIPLTKTSDAGLWYFLWSVYEQTTEQTIATAVIWNAIELIMTSL